VTADASALYPAAEGRGAAWFRTLRAVLERMERSESPAGPGAAGSAHAADAADITDAADVADTAHAAPSAGSEPDAVWEPRGGAGTAPQTAPDPSLPGRLRRLCPEAAEVPPDALDGLLAGHAGRIAELCRAFGLGAGPLLTALGRGLEPGELDASTAEAVADGAEGLGDLIASGSVTVRRDGRSTTLIAALTVGDTRGPVRLGGEPWERRGLTDVWLCAVRPQSRPVDTGRALLERILPQIGVLRAQLRAVGDRELHIGLHSVDPAADADLVAARLEAWRSAVEQLGPPAIVWEQA
jgi:hypothetical protein